MCFPVDDVHDIDDLVFLFFPFFQIKISIPGRDGPVEGERVFPPEFFTHFGSISLYIVLCISHVAVVKHGTIVDANGSIAPTERKNIILFVARVILSLSAGPDRNGGSLPVCNSRLISIFRV